MAYTTPRTWTTGEVVTAAQLNANVRDNVSFLANVPRVRVQRSATQSLSNNVVTDLTWNLEQYDTDGMHSIVTNTDRLTIVTPGLYEFKVCSEFAGNATGHRSLYLTHSDNTVIAAHQFPSMGSAIAPILFCAGEYRMAAGEWMRAQGWQTSGGALIIGNSARDFFSARWVAL